MCKEARPFRPHECMAPGLLSLSCVNTEPELTFVALSPATTCGRATLCVLPIHPQGDEITHAVGRPWLSQLSRLECLEHEQPCKGRRYITSVQV